MTPKEEIDLLRKLRDNISWRGGWAHVPRHDYNATIWRRGDIRVEYLVQGKCSGEIDVP